MKIYAFLAGLLLIAVFTLDTGLSIAADTDDTKREVFTVSTAPDIDGKWSGVLREEDRQPLTLTYNFRQNGDVLTGTVVGEPDEWIPIRDGIISGNNFSFTVDVEFQRTKMTFYYEGVIKGDDEIELTFTIEQEGWTGHSVPQSFTVNRVE